MQSLRTSDERFADLSGHPFAPDYVDVSDQDADQPGGTLRVRHRGGGPAASARLTQIVVDAIVAG